MAYIFAINKAIVIQAMILKARIGSQCMLVKEFFSVSINIIKCIIAFEPILRWGKIGRKMVQMKSVIHII